MNCEHASRRHVLRMLLGTLSIGLMTTAAEAATGNDGTEAEIQKGRYLATAADCAACHTVRSDMPYAGGYGIPSPFGTIYSTNITPSRTHGIGTYTEADFSRALRLGITPDGKHLYPAMPYTAYANLTNNDTHNLYVYFMNAVNPVEQSGPQTQLIFPMNLRFLMVGWNWLYLNRQDKSVPDVSPSVVARGAYLATALAHCDVCHTPRNTLMAEIPRRNLGGAALSSWYAPNITPDYPSGISTWTDEQIRLYLRTGNVPGKAQAAGPMAEAIEKSFQYLSESDVDAIIAYLRQLPPVRDPAYKHPRDSYGAPAHIEAAIRGTKDSTLTHGELLYSRECASCHQPTGQGSRDGYYPQLFHNTATGAPDPGNLISVILNGVRRNIGNKIVYMPGFGDHGFVDRLSDRDIADIVNEIEIRFGNPEVQVTQEQVKTIRGEGRYLSPTLVNYVYLTLGVVALSGLLMFILIFSRRRKTQE